jgi:hypothetical protein
VKSKTLLYQTIELAKQGTEDLNVLELTLAFQEFTRQLILD